MSQGYPLPASEAEVARLRMQSDLFRGDAESMLDRIGVQLGWRCLDLCCGVGGITDLLSRRVGLNGEVIGLDADSWKLEVARDWARMNLLDNVRYIEGDAFDTGLTPASFDLVHTRFALGVIPNGVRMLDHILSLVRPGGVVFLEEADIGTLLCVPGHRAWDRAVDAMTRVFGQVGADLELGRKLFALLRRAGLGELRVRPCVHALRAGQPMMLHIPATLEVMRASVLSMGLMSAPELDQVLADLRRHLSAPETLMISYAMIQVTGRVPGP
jgi:SAM-dependent methyltransferase